LGYNRFVGTLPSDWWQGENTLKRIRHIHLDHNQLTGTIPNEFMTMGDGRMNQVFLNDNAFTGVFPGDCDPCNLLNALEMQNNLFTEIDRGVCQYSVFNGGEMTAMGSDCSICPCGIPFCWPGICTVDTAV